MLNLNKFKDSLQVLEKKSQFYFMKRKKFKDS
jgi:hypothetical protein